MKRLRIASVALLMVPVPALADGPPDPAPTITVPPIGFTERTLPNGLRLIVKEDHRAPTVAHQIWYRVGGIDEVSGTTGVAHMLEHMMFKGTPKVGVGEFSKQVAALGGRPQAWLRERSGSRSFSLVGQMGPMVSAAATQQLFDLAVAPVHPWDALVCASDAERQVLEREFSRVAGYLGSRFGAQRFELPTRSAPTPEVIDALVATCAANGIDIVGTPLQPKTF